MFKVKIIKEYRSVDLEDEVNGFLKRKNIKQAQVSIGLEVGGYMYACITYEVEE